MKLLPVHKIIFNETTSRNRILRIAEPNLIMDQAEQTQAYIKEGQISGSLFPVYFFILQRLNRYIRPGDEVLDLACGSGEILIRLAQMYPKTRFHGVDLSPTMLRVANENKIKFQLNNIQFYHNDVTKLHHLFPSMKFDGIISTLALHHLPTPEQFSAVFREINAVLSEGGFVFICDFVRLKSEKTMNLFVNHSAAAADVFFQQDYYHSLRAAFSISEYKVALSALNNPRVRVVKTLIPFFAIVELPPEKKKNKLHELWRKMNFQQKLDYVLMKLFFGPRYWF